MGALHIYMQARGYLYVCCVGVVGVVQVYMCVITHTMVCFVCVCDIRKVKYCTNGSYYWTHFVFVKRNIYIFTRVFGHSAITPFLGGCVWHTQSVCWCTCVWLYVVRTQSVCCCMCVLMWVLHTKSVCSCLCLSHPYMQGCHLLNWERTTKQTKKTKKLQVSHLHYFPLCVT